jgi:hypothetical protein
VDAAAWDVAIRLPFEDGDLRFGLRRLLRRGWAPEGDQLGELRAFDEAIGEQTVEQSERRTVPREGGQGRSEGGDRGLVGGGVREQQLDRGGAFLIGGQRAVGERARVEVWHAVELEHPRSEEVRAGHGRVRMREEDAGQRMHKVAGPSVTLPALERVEERGGELGVEEGEDGWHGKGGVKHVCSLVPLLPCNLRAVDEHAYARRFAMLAPRERASPIEMRRRSVQMEGTEVSQSPQPSEIARRPYQHGSCTRQSWTDTGPPTELKEPHMTNLKNIARLLTLCGISACGDRVLGWPWPETDDTSTGDDTAETDTDTADITPPTVIATVPLDLATVVALDALVLATFSEAMDPETVSAATFGLTDADGATVLGAVYYDVGDHLATFAPRFDLIAGELYTASVTTGATDLAANAMADAYTWSFTTDDSTIDDTPPEVILTDPAANELDVRLDILMTMTFSEPMDPVTISATSIELVDADGVAVLGAVYYDVFGRTATFAPAEDLEAGAVYDATVTTGVRDLSGQPMVSDHLWSFTTDDATIDSTRPTVVSTDPTDLAVEVLVSTLVEATFSEGMDPFTLTSSSVELVDPDGFLVTSAVFYDVPTNTVSLVPDLELLGQTTYTATVLATAADLAGNTLLDDYVWSFTTADVTAPMVILTDPEDLAINVDIDALVSFTFSEEMDPLTIDTSTFELATPDGVLVTGVLSFDEPSKTGVFVPDVELDEDTTYVATVTTGATDLDGLGLEEDYQWSFTTDAWALARVDLGSLETFVAVAGSGLTNSNSSGITTLGGDVGLSPTGTCLGDGVPCTILNPVVTGTMYINDAIAAQAKVDLLAAYIDAMGRPVGTTVNDISGMTLPAGVYTSGSTMSIAVGSTVTLDGGGDANAVWIFQIGSSLTVNNNAQVLLTNGANADNVFWATFASSTLGSDVAFQGTVLAGASNSVGTDSTVVGRLLATTGAITLLANTITLP